MNYIIKIILGFVLGSLLGAVTALFTFFSGTYLISTPMLSGVLHPDRRLDIMMSGLLMLGGLMVIWAIYDLVYEGILWKIRNWKSMN